MCVYVNEYIHPPCRLESIDCIIVEEMPPPLVQDMLHPSLGWKRSRFSSHLNKELGHTACFAIENVRRHHPTYLWGQSLNALACSFVTACASDLLLEKSWPEVATAPSPKPQNEKSTRTNLNIYSLEDSCCSQLHWPVKKIANVCCCKPLRLGRGGGQEGDHCENCFSKTWLAQRILLQKYTQK